MSHPAVVRLPRASTTTPSLRPRRPRRAVGTLAAMPVGARGTVTEVGAGLDPAAARRLVHLGFAPGTLVEVVRRAPLGDPTVFRVADTEIALRRRHATAIGVEPQGA